MRPQSKSVRIFTDSLCPWCESAKRFCTEHGIEFTEVDVQADRRGYREMVLMTGQHGVPVVQVGEKAIVGWDPREFRRLMGLEPAKG